MEFLSDVGGGQDPLRPSFFELAAQGPLFPTCTQPPSSRLRRYQNNSETSWLQSSATYSQ